MWTGNKSVFDKDKGITPVLHKNYFWSNTKSHLAESVNKLPEMIKVHLLPLQKLTLLFCVRKYAGPEAIYDVTKGYDMSLKSGDDTQASLP